MLGATQSLFADCLLSTRVGGACVEGQTPPMSTIIWSPRFLWLALGMRLRELVYADDICLLATSPAKLQA